ncbi:MAG: hypothetical protein Tsb0014_13160 [Pleurocapsa sp.]
MVQNVIQDFEDSIDLFGLPTGLSSSDLMIINNELLTIVNNVDAVDLTMDDFTAL